MKILVISDSHERRDLVKQCIEQHPQAGVVIHLGDHDADIRAVQSAFPDRTFYSVRGNCDFGEHTPISLVAELEGVKIFMTHGHHYAVNYGLVTLMAAARKEGASICLYGHTHVPCNEYHDGLYVMNPGSIAYPRDSSRQSYGMIEICPQGIMTNIAEFKKIY